MELSNRKKKILQELLVNEVHITGVYLGNMLRVSSRTIRSEIKELNGDLESIDVMIKSAPSKGYFLLPIDKDKINNLLDGTIEYKIPILPGRRIEFIVKELMINPSGVSLKSLSNEIYVSESTLKRDFEKVYEYLSRYNVVLSKNKDNKYMITGKEESIRELYFDFISSRGIETLDFKDIRLQYITNEKVLGEIMSSSEIDFSGNEFYTVLLFITIMMYRIKNGNNLQNYTLNNDRTDTLVDDYIDIISRTLQISRDEINAFKDFLYNIFSAYIGFDEMTELIQPILHKSCLAFSYNPSQHLELRLAKIMNKKKHVALYEYSLLDISKQYPYAFELAFLFIEALKEAGMNVADDSVKHIVLAFVNDIEEDKYQNEIKQVNVVVVTESGKISKRLINTKIKRHFSNFKIIGFYGTHEIKTLQKLKYDLLISTKSIVLEDKQVVVINPLFKDYDIVKINNALNRLENSNKRIYELSNLFREDLFISDIVLNSPTEIIKRLYELLELKGIVDDEFLEKVSARENISSTAIGNMVAIPHAINKGSKESIAAVAILRHPINWHGNKVQIVFLLNISSISHNHVKSIFDSLYDLITSTRKIKTLIKSENYYDFVKNISL